MSAADAIVAFARQSNVEMPYGDSLASNAYVQGLLRAAQIARRAEREFMHRVDSACSLAAYRGVDDETKAELIAVSAEARRAARGPDEVDERQVADEQ